MGKYTFAAPLPDGTDWEIEVTATDRPGHRTVATQPATAIKWL